MRLCLITPEYPPMQGGVGDYTSYLALALRKLGLEVGVLTSSRAKPRAERADVHDGVAPRVESWSFSCWRSILAHVSRFRPDVLHIQYQTAGYGMHPAINLLPFVLRAQRKRPRVVTTFHDLKVPYLFPKAGAIRQLPARLLAATSDAVVVTNAEDLLSLSGPVSLESWRGQISSPLRTGKMVSDGAEEGISVRRCSPARPFAYRGRPLFTIPIGSNIPKSSPENFDRELWRRSHRIEPDELLLVYFGFLNQTKGVDVLIDAFLELVGDGLGARLLMAGGSFGDSDPTNLAYGQRIVAQVQASAHRSRVLWTGFVSREEISASLLSSDICVLPFDEGASLRHGTLIAAIAHELPIITTRAPGQLPDHPAFPSLHERVKLIPPRDVRALTKAVLELGESKSLRHKLGKAVGELARAFDWGTVAKAHVEVYDRLDTAK